MTARMSTWLLISALVALATFASAQEPKQKERAAKRDRQKQPAGEAQLDASEVMTYKKVGDVELSMYIFNPADQAAGMKRPAVVFFFGGGWSGGTPRQFEQHCKYLASRGIVAMAADYRVYTRQKAKVADCVSDAKSAIRWVRANAARLGVDADRIVAAGGSAGGHLAAATGTLAGFDSADDDSSVSSRPNAMILFNPALDLRHEAFQTTSDSPRYADMAARFGASAEELSPAMHVSRDTPPAIIFHGEDDTSVPFAQAEAFREAMGAAGVACVLADYEGQAHGFFNFGRGDNSMFRDTMTKADKFLGTLGYTIGEPTVDEFFK